MEEDIQKALEVQNNTAMGSIADSIESRIFTIRGKQVMIDRDLAELYGVETKNLNKAVKRNIERFPENFMFQLTWEECSRFQIGTMENQKGHNLKYKPYAFTEQGVSQLSAVLRSPIAIGMSIKIIEAFVAIRHYIISNSGMLQRIEVIERKQIETSAQVDAILDRMQALEPKQPQEHRSKILATLGEQ